MSEEVSIFRLYLMRALYLLIFVGQGTIQWPQIRNASTYPFWHGIGSSLLAAMALLSILGLRYPLQMLPLLFFELVWKSIWLLAVALPLWSAHRIDAELAETVRACLMGVIVPIVIPWPFVVSHYLKAPGARWR